VFNLNNCMYLSGLHQQLVYQSPCCLLYNGPFLCGFNVPFKRLMGDKKTNKYSQLSLLHATKEKITKKELKENRLGRKEYKKQPNNL